MVVSHEKNSQLKNCKRHGRQSFNNQSTKNRRPIIKQCMLHPDSFRFLGTAQVSLPYEVIRQQIGCRVAQDNATGL
jgi:hypothetical protein